MLCIVLGTYFKLNDTEKVAKEYVRDVLQGNWNEVYDYFYFPKDNHAFLSKKMFVSAQELSNDIRTFQVSIGDVKEVGKGSRNQRQFEVTYRDKRENKKMIVPMIRQKGEWYVDGRQQFVEEVAHLEVPHNTKVYLDKVPLDNVLIRRKQKVMLIFMKFQIFSVACIILHWKKKIWRNTRI